MMYGSLCSVLPGHLLSVLPGAITPDLLGSPDSQQNPGWKFRFISLAAEPRLVIPIYFPGYVTVSMLTLYVLYAPETG